MAAAMVGALSAVHLLHASHDDDSEDGGAEEIRVDDVPAF